MHNLHVGIIMDGNGRWAQRRGLPRTAGHIEGAEGGQQNCRDAARAGMRVITLYAFSSDNWRRPGTEVTALMGLLRRYITTETRRCIEQSIRINFIGRRDRLTPRPGSRDRAERAAHRRLYGMLLRIAVDYSSQHSILEASRLAAPASQ